MTLDADLYSSANAFITNLPDVLSRSWRDQFGDLGSGQIVMDYADSDLSACTRKRIIKFSDNGTVRFACVIGPRAQTTIGPDEKASKQRTIGGPGVATLLNGARVFGGTGLRLPAQQRFFGWPTGVYDDSSWPNAQELWRQDSVLYGYGTLYPSGWPDPTAWWVWSRLPVAGPPPHPVGISYFRGQLVVPDDGDVRFYIAADDAWKLYIADELVQQRTDEFGWRSVSPFTQYLTAGTYQIAIEAENVYRVSDATNYAGLLFAAYSTGFGGIDVDLLLHTDDIGSFVCSDYPAVAPGMTAGAIVKAILDENHFLGVLSEVTQGAWDETQDENGDPWDVELNVAYNVGTSLLDVVKNLAATAIDWWVDPDTLELKLYNKGTLGVASGVTFSEGTHYTGLTHQESELPPTHLLTRKTSGGYTVLSSGAGGQTVLGFLEATTAPDDGQATKAADAVFAIPADTLTGTIESRAGAVPYVDIKPGDRFTTIDIGGSASTSTLVALTVTDRPAGDDGTVGGDPIYGIEATQ